MRKQLPIQIDLVAGTLAFIGAIDRELLPSPVKSPLALASHCHTLNRERVTHPRPRRQDRRIRKNPHLIETGYRSPQLTLWTLGPDEWLL
jgi:hypothetical protein